MSEKIDDRAAQQAQEMSERAEIDNGVTQQAQAMSERTTTNDKSFFGSIGDYISDAATSLGGVMQSSRDFVQNDIKGGIGEFASYGDNFSESMDDARHAIVNKPFEIAEGFVFGLFSWDWGKDFSFSKNYETQSEKAGNLWDSFLNSFTSYGKTMDPSKLLDIFGLNSQKITTQEDERAANGDERTIPNLPSIARDL